MNIELTDRKWAKVPGYELYVSHDGMFVLDAKDLKPRKIYQDKLGYKNVYIKEEKKSVSLHHLVLIAFGHPQPSLEYEVHHFNANPSINHIKNLAWVTRQKHAFYREKRFKRNACVYYKKGPLINDLLRLQIAIMYKNQTRFANASGIDNTTISKIIKGKRNPTKNQQKIISDLLKINQDLLFPQYEIPTFKLELVENCEEKKSVEGVI